jgi:ribosome-associated translation inhibitor RaiA
MKINDERQASVTWGALLTGALGLLTFSAALLSVFIWIYVELSKQSKELSDFRVEVAQSYVTVQALHTVETRSKEDKEALQHALDKLGDRFDRSLEKMERAVVDRLLNSSSDPPRSSQP